MCVFIRGIYLEEVRTRVVRVIGRVINRVISRVINRVMLGL